MPGGSRRRPSRNTRDRVFRRDGERCRYCGIRAERRRLTIDHIVPISRWPEWAHSTPNVRANLVVACKTCQRIKGSLIVPGVDFTPDGALNVNWKHLRYAMARLRQAVPARKQGDNVLSIENARDHPSPPQGVTCL